MDLDASEADIPAVREALAGFAIQSINNVYAHSSQEELVREALAGASLPEEEAGEEMRREVIVTLEMTREFGNHWHPARKRLLQRLKDYNVKSIYPVLRQGKNRTIEIDGPMADWAEQVVANSPFYENFQDFVVSAVRELLWREDPNSEHSKYGEGKVIRKKQVKDRVPLPRALVKALEDAVKKGELGFGNVAEIVTYAATHWLARRERRRQGKRSLDVAAETRAETRLETKILLNDQVVICLDLTPGDAIWNVWPLLQAKLRQSLENAGYPVEAVSTVEKATRWKYKD